MADVTTVLEKSKPGYVFQNMEEGRIFNVGVGDPGMTGIKAIGTHEIADIAAEEAVIGGQLIFLESVTSADAATMQLKLGAIALTGVLAIADMAKGKVVSFEMSAASLALYLSAADTVDITIADFVLTGGRFLMKLNILDVDSVINRG